jgi:hypothetical protein
MENDRRGNFHRVFPSPDFTATYKNFFEEERYNDILLFDYIFSKRYKQNVLMNAFPKKG